MLCQSADLFSVEVAIFIAVGDGDCEEVVMCARVGGQSVQSPLQFSTTRSLNEKQQPQLDLNWF